MAFQSAHSSTDLGCGGWIISGNLPIAGRGTMRLAKRGGEKFLRLFQFLKSVLALKVKEDIIKIYFLYFH